MMWNILRAELYKIRRCQIFLVGIVALALCPVMQYGSQLIMDPNYRELNFDFADLFSNVVWGNTQVFLPVSLVMTGGWLIDRETVNDTMKNIVTVPVSMPRLLCAKLLVMGLLAVLLGGYSICTTLLTGVIAGLPGLTLSLIWNGGIQVVAAAFTTYLVCMPMILVFGQIRGAYLGGSILAFFLGYSMLFFKDGILLSAYPFSAALILVGFDMAQYNGAVSPPDGLMAAAGMCLMLLITLILLAGSGRRREVTVCRVKKKRGRRR